MAASLGANYSMPATVTVRPEYMMNAIIVMLSILPSLIPNCFILIVGLKSGVIQDKFRDSIVTMTSGNLLSALIPLMFHLFYVAANCTQMAINFYVCTFLRRLTAMSYSPMLYGCVTVATDRFFGVCRNYHFSRSRILILNMTLAFFPFLTFVSQMTSDRVLMEDICGPTLASRFSWIGEINTVLLILYPLIALCLNVYILVFVNQKAKKLSELGARVSCSRDTTTERHVLYGMILQSLLPIISQIPMLTGILFYYRGFHVPTIVWHFSNVIYHLDLTLNPVFTVIFVKQFRVAVTRLVTCSTTTVTTVSASQYLSFRSSTRTANS